MKYPVNSSVFAPFTRASRLGMCLVLAGCSGAIGIADPNGGSNGGAGSTVGNNSGGSTGGIGGTVSVDVCAKAAPSVGNTRVRRLTRSQLDNTFRDLLGTTARPASALAQDEKVGPFFSNSTIPLDELQADQIMNVVEGLANAAPIAKLAGCDAAMANNAAANKDCADRFIADFGRRAYRRPLTIEEKTRFATFYDAQLVRKGHEGVLRLIVEAMLQSPVFLYHSPFGSAGSNGTALKPLTQYELASRLAYFIWDSMPDEALFKVAADGMLTDRVEIGRQIDRMLADSKAADGRDLFFESWLGLEGMATLEKSAPVYPDFSAAMRRAMIKETRDFVAHVMSPAEGRLSTLLSAGYSFPPAEIFDLYEIPAGSTAGQKGVALNTAQRAGILTQASFLAVHAHPDQGSPVRRGVIVRDRILCQPLPDPPANVNNTPPSPDPKATTRERFEQHRVSSECKSCHELIDPIGVGFEHYDGMGRYRETENGKPINAKGDVVDGGDASGLFDGAPALAMKFAASQEVASCVSRQFFRFALGRLESEADDCALIKIDKAFAESGNDMRVLMRELVLSDVFEKLAP